MPIWNKPSSTQTYLMYGAAATISNDEYKAIGISNSSSGGSGDLRNDYPVSLVYTPGIAGLKALNTPLTGWKGANQVSDLLRNGKV